MDLGKLQGTKITELFRYLVESGTIVSVQAMGGKFERLTCVIEVRESVKQNQLVVDIPHGFQEEVEKLQPWVLQFNFNGPDKVEHIFVTQGGRRENQALVLPFPEFVQRLQRRRDFRIQTPMGTQMHFQKKNFSGTIDLINISLSGAYGVFRQKGQAVSNRPVLKVKELIFKIAIHFPGRCAGEREAIHIQKAEVIRVEQDIETHQNRYAFEFKLIDREAKQQLTSEIYRLQREYLQRR